MCPSVSVRKSTKWRRKHPLGFPTGLRDHEAVGSNPATRTMRSVLIGFEHPTKDTLLFCVENCINQPAPGSS